MKSLQQGLAHEPAIGFSTDGDRVGTDSPKLRSIETAILSVVAYHDQFDYPLSPSEIHYYLHQLCCEAGKVRGTLGTSPVLRSLLITDGRRYALADRQELFDTRRRRQDRAALMWPRVRRLGAMLFNLPCVRFVGLTGSIAARNPGRDADIDFMVITDFGVMWRVRALTKLFQWLDRRIGSGKLCPNYFLTTEGLEIESQRLYVAHELAMMVPLYGSETYDSLIAANSWTRSFLPNASERKLDTPICDEVPMPRLRRAAEWITRAVERYESDRKLYLYNETDFLDGRWSRFSHRACGHRMHIVDAIEQAWQERLKAALAATGTGQ